MLSCNLFLFNFPQTLEESFLKASLEGWFYKESMFNKKVRVLWFLSRDEVSI